MNGFEIINDETIVFCFVKRDLRICQYGLHCDMFPEKNICDQVSLWRLLVTRDWQNFFKLELLDLSCKIKRIQHKVMTSKRKNYNSFTSTSFV